MSLLNLAASRFPCHNTHVMCSMFAAVRLLQQVSRHSLHAKSSCRCLNKCCRCYPASAFELCGVADVQHAAA
jgi:hypothetical protein